MATKALMTNAKGLARLAALLPLAAGLVELFAPSPVGEAVTDTGTEEVTVLVVVPDNEARLNVVLRETGTPVPVPMMPVPMTIAVVTLPGTTVVATRLLLLDDAMAESNEDTKDETDADAAEVTEAADAEVLEAEDAEVAETAVLDDAFTLTDETMPDPPESVNCPE